MSYSPKTGRAYIPKVELAARFNDQKNELIDWRSPKFRFDVAVDTGFGNDIPRDTGVSALIAWDPIRQRKVWEAPQDGFWNPGTMVTAGNPSFPARAECQFIASAAKAGRKPRCVCLGSGAPGRSLP